MPPLGKLRSVFRDLVRRLFALGPRRPLCDRCKWDWGDVCTRPERPNALDCPDFKKRR